MNVKIRDLLIKVIEKTNSNGLSWEDKNDFLEITLKNGVRVATNRVTLLLGSPQFRYILEFDNGVLCDIVNPWDEDMGYEVWSAVYQAAVENVKLKNSNLN
jgi:hypothetical protein